MASNETDRLTPEQNMTTKLKRGSGEPRMIAGDLQLNAGPDTVSASIAERAKLPDKHFKSLAAREASLLQLAKSTRTGKAVSSNKSVPNKLPHGLTIRQEQFCQNVMAGMTHAQAYREAYNCHHIKPAVVYARAYAVATNPRAKKRMEELWALREGRLSHTPAQLRLFVQERLMIEALKEDNPASVRVRAVELIGKIGRVRVFDAEQDNDKGNQSVEQLMQRIGPLLELGKALQAQMQAAEKPKQIKDRA